VDSQYNTFPSSSRKNSSRKRSIYVKGGDSGIMEDTISDCENEDDDDGVFTLTPRSTNSTFQSAATADTEMLMLFRTEEEPEVGIYVYYLRNIKQF
jgi:hypothetical protein